MARPKKDIGDVPQFRVHRFRKIVLILILAYIAFILISNYGFNNMLDIVNQSFNDIGKSNAENTVTGTPDGTAVFTFIDVGQGDSTLIQFGDYDILVDAGEKAYGDDVVKVLEDAGVDDLEFLVATHPHSDHIGGINEVLDNIVVENFVMPDVEHTTNTYEKMLDSVIEKDINVIIPYQGQKLVDVEGAMVTVISPEICSDDNLNNYSICLRVDYGNTRLILTGDAEIKIEDMILDSGVDINADIFQVGHHGSVTSNSQGFLNAMKPQIAIVSAGEGNDYGHPHEEVTDRLTSVGATIYSTIDKSTITIITDGDEIKVEY